MADIEQERWKRVRERLRAKVGDDIYTSWFARMELESVEDDTVKLSVPTRFLKSWIGSHYSEQLLGCWQAEDTAIKRIEISMRSAVIRPLATPSRSRPRRFRLPRETREFKSNGGGEHRGPTAPISAVHEALGGSPLDPRLTFGSFVIGRSNTLAHAAAKQVAEASAATS